MQAFLNDPKLKADLLIEVEKHRIADDLVAGTYGDECDGRFVGCAVGCSIESLNRLRGKHYETRDHSSYPELVGVPEWLARIQDIIFEGLPSDRQKLWPGQFWDAIPVGVDLEQVKAPFLVFVLRMTYDTFDHKKYPDVKRAVDRVIELYETSGTEADFYAAAAAAGNEAYAVRAAANAVYLRAPADAAANAAAYAAEYAAYAAYAEYTAADAAYAARSAAYAARSASNAAECFVMFADELLRLFRATGGQLC